MNTSNTTLKEPVALSVEPDADVLAVFLTDGRSVTVPIAWFPRLAHGTKEERSNWRLIGNGEGIHWPDLDEDIRVASLLEGRRSSESQESLKRWLSTRTSR